MWDTGIPSLQGAELAPHTSSFNLDLNFYAGAPRALLLRAQLDRDP